MFGTAAAAAHNPNKDFEAPSPPSDGVSSLIWSPRANYLVAGSWDGKIRCWEVSPRGDSVAKAMISHDAPVLCTAWNTDGTQVFSGGCDNKAKCWNLATNQILQVAQHNAPIKAVSWVEDLKCLVTGSWDKSLRYWDCRQPNAVHTVNLPERVYCMDVMSPLAVVGLAERHILIYDLRKPQSEYKKQMSPLKYQSRVVACFPDKTGYALGSIEGRVAIQHVEDKDQANNFAFKCHRENNDIYSVNSIAFHQQFGTFATAGADGTYNFWDKDSKQRLKAFAKCNAPIPCSSFNADGTLYAYAVSYDWSKGHEFYNAQQPNYVLIHPVGEDIKPRGGKVKKAR